MGNRILISAMHGRGFPVHHRFEAEKRAEKWRVGYDSDQLRARILKLMGLRQWGNHDAWQASNCGISYICFGAWMAGEKLPSKYHMAMTRWLDEAGV